MYSCCVKFNAWDSRLGVAVASTIKSMPLAVFVDKMFVT